MSTTLLRTIGNGSSRKEWGCCWKGVAAVVVVATAAVVVAEAGSDHSELSECFFRRDMTVRFSGKLQGTNLISRLVDHVT